MDTAILCNVKQVSRRSFIDFGGYISPEICKWSTVLLPHLNAKHHRIADSAISKN